MKKLFKLLMIFLFISTVLWAMPKPEKAIRMVEINGGMPLGVEFMKKFIDFTVEESEGTVNAIRIFTDMPPSWTNGINKPSYSLYKRPIRDVPSRQVHKPALSKLVSLLEHIKSKEYDLKIQIVILNRCSAVERKWQYKYYSEEWWNRYHKHFIRNLVNALKDYEDYIIWEFCNESNTTASWEISGSRYLKELGCKVTCSSPMSNFSLIKKHGKFDFLWLHGAWVPDKFDREYFMFHCSNLRIGYSGDGFSKLRWFVWGGGGSHYYQWDKRSYGRLPTKSHTIKQLQKVNDSNNHFSVNMSGAIERLEPRWGYYRSILKAFFETCH